MNIVLYIMTSCQILLANKIRISNVGRVKRVICICYQYIITVLSAKYSQFNHNVDHLLKGLITI